MRSSLALAIGAVFYILVGLTILLAPAQVLSAGGWPATPDIALVAARDSGTVLIVLGFINWVARDVVGAPLRGLLWANILRPAASLVVNGWELAAGVFPTTVVGVSLAAFGLDVALIVMFALALRRA